MAGDGQCGGTEQIGVVFLPGQAIASSGSQDIESSEGQPGQAWFSRKLIAEPGLLGTNEFVHVAYLWRRLPYSTVTDLAKFRG